MGTGWGVAAVAEGQDQPRHALCLEFRACRTWRLNIDYSLLPTSDVKLNLFKTVQDLQRIPESWNMGLGGFVLGSLITLP